MSRASLPLGSAVRTGREAGLCRSLLGVFFPFVFFPPPDRHRPACLEARVGLSISPGRLTPLDDFPFSLIASRGHGYDATFLSFSFFPINRRREEALSFSLRRTGKMRGRSTLSFFSFRCGIVTPFAPFFFFFEQPTGQYRSLERGVAVSLPPEHVERGLTFSSPPREYQQKSRRPPFASFSFP